MEDAYAAVLRDLAALKEAGQVRGWGCLGYGRACVGICACMVRACAGDPQVLVQPCTDRPPLPPPATP